MSSYTALISHPGAPGQLPVAPSGPSAKHPSGSHNSFIEDGQLRPARTDGPSSLLLVGCSVELRHQLRSRLDEAQWSIREAHSASEALEKLIEHSGDVMLVDPQLSDLEASEFESIVRDQFPAVQILSVDAQSSLPGDDVRKQARVSHQVGDILQMDSVVPAAEKFPAVLHSPQSSGNPEAAWEGIIGSAASMQRVFHAAKVVARRDTTVLIQGESGTGKDLLAKAVHNLSARKKQPFVVINCAAIPEPLLESELFGHTKGSFTGAAQSRLGRVQSAHGGTLFLDEIGDMPFPLQSKILRFLEQGEVQRIGGTDTLKVDCRIIAATNADLKKLVKTNHFREDLYYRLAVFPIQLPPLRDRMADLDSLISAFVDRFGPGKTIDSRARQLLFAHDWPGNIRELRNVIERASLYADARGEILAEDIVL